MNPSCSANHKHTLNLMHALCAAREAHTYIHPLALHVTHISGGVCAGADLSACMCVCVFVVRVIVKTSSHCGDLEIGRGVWHSSVLECVSTALVEKFHLFTFSFPFHLLYLPPTAPPLCLSLNANSIFI